MADPRITVDLTITVTPEAFELLERQLAELKRIAAALAPVDVGDIAAPEEGKG